MDRLKLFDSDGSSSDEDLSKIEINREFAKRYEHNKKREELQRYEVLKKQGLVDSSGSDSEESFSEEEEPSKRIDADFFDALLKVKNQDPILREKDAKLFISDDEDDGDEDNASKKKGKNKPMYLKDVVSKQLIEAGPEFSDEEMESGDDDSVKNRVKSYSEEQEEMRQGFVKALEEEENDDDDDNEDLFKVKSSGKDDEEEEDDDGIGDKLDEYFGEDEKLDGDTKFLKDYFRNRMWADDGKSNRAGDVDIDVSEDEDEIEKQEDYERGYNFRFEENAGDRVMGHSRKVEGSVRKKDNARKSQRERKEERMAQAEFERKEELKRLKNLKKKEINEKLEKIREVAGIGKAAPNFLDKDDLEEEFDPAAHDRKMKEAFGEDYYGAEDVDPGFGSDEDEEEFEKPDFDKEDELLGFEKGWDKVDKSGEGFKSARERIMKDRVANGDENVADEDESDEPGEGKRKRNRKPSEVEKAVMEQFLEEYYKLDYEDTIGDLKTRFKYKPVKPKRYGLATEEVLTLDDKELNQYVSLKKLAPYREMEWKVPRIKTIQLKKSKQYLTGNTSRPFNKHRERKAKEEEVNAVESERSQPIESNGDDNTISRKKKRKLQQAELKLSQSRLMAYGKIPTKSKSKNQ
ncbi:hypothetical protein C2S52_000426 [Perilla frutescens var. hirtella]|nr:hypothetical protein C2S52_000426 [Perilla frutescens var. hirtella]